MNIERQIIEMRARYLRSLTPLPLPSVMEVGVSSFANRIPSDVTASMGDDDEDDGLMGGPSGDEEEVGPDDMQGRGTGEPEPPPRSSLPPDQRQWEPEPELDFEYPNQGWTKPERERPKWEPKTGRRQSDWPTGEFSGRGPGNLPAFKPGEVKATLGMEIEDWIQQTQAMNPGDLAVWVDRAIVTQNDIRRRGKPSQVQDYQNFINIGIDVLNGQTPDPRMFRRPADRQINPSKMELTGIEMKGGPDNGGVPGKRAELTFEEPGFGRKLVLFLMPHGGWIYENPSTGNRTSMPRDRLARLIPLDRADMASEFIKKNQGPETAKGLEDIIKTGQAPAPQQWGSRGQTPPEPAPSSPSPSSPAQQAPAATSTQGPEGDLDIAADVYKDFINRNAGKIDNETIEAVLGHYMRKSGIDLEQIGNTLNRYNDVNLDRAIKNFEKRAREGFGTNKADGMVWDKILYMARDEKLRRTGAQPAPPPATPSPAPRQQTTTPGPAPTPSWGSDEGWETIEPEPESPQTSAETPPPDQWELVPKDNGRYGALQTEPEPEAPSELPPAPPGAQDKVLRRTYADYLTQNRNQRNSPNYQRMVANYAASMGVDIDRLRNHIGQQSDEILQRTIQSLEGRYNRDKGKNIPNSEMWLYMLRVAGDERKRREGVGVPKAQPASTPKSTVAADIAQRAQQQRRRGPKPKIRFKSTTPETGGPKPKIRFKSTTPETGGA